MIEAKNLSKSYGKASTHFQALQAINLTIGSRDSVAIIGKSGSGKSTLMHILSGLDHPTTGTVMIDDTDLFAMKQKTMDDFRARQMSFIFQSFFVEAHQTCYQNVMLPLEIARVPRGRRRRLVLDALQAVELSDKADQPAGNLSGGQKQRLAIARAIVNRPRILFADEPTGNLDSATGDKIVRLLFDLHKNLECTLIIVTHDADLAAQCDVEVKLADGQIISTTDRRKQAA